MGLFDFLRGYDINKGVEEWKASDQGILLDVRTAAEYRERHIPGSINIPLDEIGRAETKIPNREVPLFVYCLSGARSSQAVHFLKQHGYTNVKNIGGIGGYRGKATHQ